MSKVSVTLNVAGIPIKIKVSSQDEGYIRNGAKSLNNMNVVSLLQIISSTISKSISTKNN